MSEKKAEVKGYNRGFNDCYIQNESITLEKLEKVFNDSREIDFVNQNLLKYKSFNDYLKNKK